MSKSETHCPAASTDSNAPSTADSSPTGPARDVVLVGPPTPDGEGFHVLRARESRLEAGEMRGLVEGRPITGEVVTLQPRANHPRICDVTSSFRAPEAPGVTKGPAQVATQAYRDRWDAIFSSPSDPKSLN
jgi:hypothetical protein